jgi:glycosyltransferase involved in cell wall biosynthesis
VRDFALKLSVCIASYNGANFIEAQLDSILEQLSADDEIIVVDDCSIDNTVENIKLLSDSRIKIEVNEQNAGFVKTFEKALSLASGDIIFLSDQDDVWSKAKVKTISNIFLTDKIDMVVHNAIVSDDKGKIIRDQLFSDMYSNNFIVRHFIKNRHMGCCMAFKKEVVSKIIPIPFCTKTHDQWIGFICDIYKFRIRYIDDTLITWIRHNTNASSLNRRALYRVVDTRLSLIGGIIVHFCSRLFKYIFKLELLFLKE